MKKIADVVASAVEEKDLVQAARAQLILRSWSTIVGEGLAKKSHPDRYHRGTVWVAVQSSAWAQELRMMKDTILERLNDGAGTGRIFSEVRFGVRPLPEPPEQESQPPRDKSIQELTIREIADRRLANWPKKTD